MTPDRPLRETIYFHPLFGLVPGISIQTSRPGSRPGAGGGGTYQPMGCGLSCWCNATEKPKKLPFSPRLTTGSATSRLKAEFSQRQRLRRHKRRKSCVPHILRGIAAAAAATARRAGREPPRLQRASQPAVPFGGFAASCPSQSLALARPLRCPKAGQPRRVTKFPRRGNLARPRAGSLSLIHSGVPLGGAPRSHNKHAPATLSAIGHEGAGNWEAGAELPPTPSPRPGRAIRVGLKSKGNPR